MAITAQQQIVQAKSKRIKKTEAQKQVDEARKQAKRDKKSRDQTKFRKDFKAKCQEYDIPDPTFEFKFHPTRRWSMDVAWPEEQVFLEIEGGVYSGGRHTRGSGFVKDIEKYNEASSMDWLLLRCLPSTALSSAVFSTIKQTIEVAKKRKK